MLTYRDEYAITTPINFHILEGNEYIETNDVDFLQRGGGGGGVTSFHSNLKIIKPK